MEQSDPSAVSTMDAGGRPIVQLTRRPGVIDLGWGHPDPALLPVAALRRAAAEAL